MTTNKTTKNEKELSDHQKQQTPLKGEVDPKNAFSAAKIAASKYANKFKNQR